MVGVPIVLRRSNARGPSWGSALTATPGHPLLFRIKLPLPLASTLPFSKQSLEPFRERIVLDRFRDAPGPEFMTTMPPPAWLLEPVTKLPLMVVFSRVSEPFSEKIAAPASAPLLALSVPASLTPPSPLSTSLPVNVLLRTITVPLSLKMAPPRAPPPPPQQLPLPAPPKGPRFPGAPCESSSVPMPKPAPPPNPPFPP